MAAQGVITIPSTKAHPVGVSPSDTIIVAGLERSTSGGGVLFTDASTTTIVIGGGAAQTSTTINAGASSDITLASRGGSITVAQSGNTALNGVFGTASITSVIGALNAIQDGTVALPASTPTISTYTVGVQEANHVIDIGAAAVAPFFVVINGVMYSSLEGWFTVTTTTFANDTWTWQDIGAPGQLKTAWNVLTWHY